jgi:hypothetical protein
VTIAPLASMAARACAGTGVTGIFLLGDADETLPVRPGRRERSRGTPLLARMIDIHRRQVLHLLLGDAEPDLAVD